MVFVWLFFLLRFRIKKTKKNKKKSKKVLTDIFFSAIIIARKGTETPKKNRTAERQKERGITMKYKVEVISDFNVTEFESNSRNAKNI